MRWRGRDSVSQAHGEILVVSCGGPGVGLRGPDGSLPTQPIL